MKEAKGPTAPKMPPPTMRMDMPAEMDMGEMKYGDHVQVQFRGKIRRVEIGKGYDGKMRNQVEIEHDPKSIKVSKAGKKRSMHEIEEADERL